MSLWDWAEDPLPKVYGRKRQLTRPEFVRPDNWSPVESLPELSGVVALDLETKDRGLAEGKGTSWYRPDGGFICGIGIGSERTGDFYLPIRHLDGNIDPDRVMRWLKAQARKPDVTFLYANAPYDLGWLKREGIEPINLPHDIQIQAALRDEHRYEYGLDALSREFLGEGKNDDELKEACRLGGLRDPMSNMDMVPGWLAEQYGLRDIRLTRELFPLFQQQIEKEELQGIYELERECALVAVDMKEIGVKLDNNRIAQTRAAFDRKRAEYIRLVRDQTGVNVSLSDPKSIIKALRAENPNLQLPKTAQGKDSIAADALDELPPSPVVSALQWGRKYDRAIGTFIDAYLIGHQHNGRIHADFNPMPRSDDRSRGGTTSGRFSSNNPNLQNIPVRVPEIGLPIRSCFVPDDGLWAKLDYASQEPRLTIHYAALLELKGAWKMVERFRRDPLTDLHMETALLMFGHTRETWEMLDKAERKSIRARAKIINLAIAYGAGGANIAGQLGLPSESKMIIGRNGGEVRIRVAGREAQALLNKHMRAVPFLRELQQIAKERAEQQGFIRTILGRNVHFRQTYSMAGGSEYLRTYKALNALIQGSAADQMKLALVLLRRAGIRVQLTVHDEADMSVPRGADAFIAQIKGIMEEAVTLLLPVIAEVKTGAHWGETSVD